MSDILKLKYKVGQIEFEAEGSADAVEQQRINFMSTVLPAAVDAMVRTQTGVDSKTYIEANTDMPLLESEDAHINTQCNAHSKIDFSRTSLASFLIKYGVLNDQDYTLFAAYFDEQKNGTKAFSSENVKQYYQDGRRPAYSNNSVLLKSLVKKGLIMDAPKPEDAKPGNYYMLTNDGLTYISEYVPKEDNKERKATHKKQRKTATHSTIYSQYTADDLNLKNYPAVKSFSSPKEQVILAMYIVANEGKGEWFTVDDVIYLLVNIFEIPANIDMVHGVFRRNKSMFASEQDSSNKKAHRKKLLSGAKDFALELIEQKKKV